jgi:hypothetical protein
MNSDYISSWDGVQHAAIIAKYQQTIFPELYGRINSWGLGMVWTLGYNPLYTIGVSALATVSNLPVNIILILIVALASVIIAPLMYLLSLTIYRSKSVGIVTALLTLIFMLGNFSSKVMFGISFIDNFEVGLYSQIIAFVAMLISILALLLGHNRIRLYYLSILFTAAAVLLNTHIAVTLFVFLGVYYLIRLVADRSVKDLFRMIFHLALTFLLAFFWIFPFAKDSKYFLYKTQPALNLVDTLVVFVPLLIFVLFFAKYWTKKGPTRRNNLTIFITVAILLIISVFPFDQIINGLPLQPYRYTPVAYILLLLLVGYCWRGLLFVIPIAQRKFYGVILLVVLAGSSIVQIQPSLNYTVRKDVGEDELVEFLSSQANGRSIIENYQQYYQDLEYSKVPLYPVNFIISSRIAKNSEHETVWSVFRESYISAAFVQPLRNTFSERLESYGVVCYLCESNLSNQMNSGLDNGNFFYQPQRLHLERAESFGVNLIAVRSNYMKLRMQSEDLTGWYRLKSFGYWDVYTNGKSSTKVSIVRTDPILAFTAYPTSNRKVNDYDWLRINEEMFFHGQTDDHIMALSSTKLVEDSAEELSKFQLAMITDYRFNDLSLATDILTNFAKQKKLILLQEDNDLIKNLVNNPDIKPNIFVLPKTGDVRNDMQTLSAYLHRTYLEIGSYDRSYKYKDSVSFKGMDKGDLKFNVNVEPEVLQKSKFIPVLVKYNHFPWFKTDQAIYMASPTFMLTFIETNGEHTLRFEEPEYVGQSIEVSVLALCLLLAVFAIGDIGQFISRVKKVVKFIARRLLKLCLRILKFVMNLPKLVMKQY